MLEAIGAVIGFGLLALVYQIGRMTGKIVEGLDNLSKIVTDHESRLRELEDD